jgi:hypothetical protein
MRRVLVQHTARGPGGVREMIGLRIEITLDSMRIFKAAELAEFGGSKRPV